MLNLVSKCGIDCSACPWGSYSRKGMTDEEFERFRENAKRILGYMPIKTACVTCQTPDSKIPKGSRIPNRRCLIRQCVDKSGLVNCAYCSRFPCDTVKATGGVWNRENIEGRLGAPISDQEYHTFVAAGNGGRFIMITPQLGLVTVLTGGNYNQYPIWIKYRDFLPNYIFPAFLY